MRRDPLMFVVRVVLAASAGCTSQVVSTSPPIADAGGTDRSLPVDQVGTTDVFVVDDASAPMDLPVADDVPADPDAPPPTDGAKGDDAPPPSDAPRGDAPSGDVPTTACRSDRDCSALGLVCEPTRMVCVDCARDGDCLAPGTVCTANRCVPVVRCMSARMCPGQVCNLTSGTCVDCVENFDCPSGQVCRLSACVAGPRRCASPMDCAGLGQICNTASGECVQCVEGTDCPTGERCLANACVVCTPGVASCASPTSRSVCNGDGRASTTTPCATGPNRVGACAPPGICTSSCAMGFFDCDGVAANGCEAAMACPSRLIGGLGGPSGYGPATNCLHPNDDGSYSGPPPAAGAGVPVDITPAFGMGLNFFGTTYRSVYVNTNGNISFRAALGTFTPAAFPIASQPIIAPWWADVDTRGMGAPGTNNICFAVETGRLVVTWQAVGYYSAHTDLANTFQLVLADRSSIAPGDFDVEFRYDRCEWTTGDASGGMDGLGGTPAQVGFDAGNGMNYLALPMSRTAEILNVCRTTNVPGGPPGIWRYTVRGGVVTSM